MEDLASTQLDQLKKINKNMLDSCTLFEHGGNYSQPEIDWYAAQMQEIDDLLDKTKQDRQA